MLHHFQTLGLHCTLLLQELMENVADPKEFGKRGEPLFFGLLLLLALIFFPPAFFKV